MTLSDSYHHLPSESGTAGQRPRRNLVEVYGDCIDECFHRIYGESSSSVTVFDRILKVVLSDLRMAQFPRFLNVSFLFLKYLSERLSVEDIPFDRGIGAKPISDRITLRLQLQFLKMFS